VLAGWNGHGGKWGGTASLIATSRELEGASMIEGIEPSGNCRIICGQPDHPICSIEQAKGGCNALERMVPSVPIVRETGEYLATAAGSNRPKGSLLFAQAITGTPGHKSIHSLGAPQKKHVERPFPPERIHPATGAYHQ